MDSIFASHSKVSELKNSFHFIQHLEQISWASFKKKLPEYSLETIVRAYKQWLAVKFDFPLSVWDNKWQYHTLFNDLSARFCLNVPRDELQEMRLMYHIEQMYFFTIDNWFSLKERYPVLCNQPWTLKIFIQKFRKWSIHHLHLSRPLFDQLWEHYVEIYKKEIPIAGALLFRVISNEIHFLAVEGKESGKWGIPKGKCNFQETWFDCAQREVMEEIGWNGWQLVSESYPMQEMPIPTQTYELKTHSQQHKHFYFVDVSHYETKSYFGKPITPTRFYILNYDTLLQTIAKNKWIHKRLTKQFTKDRNEISNIAWLKWDWGKKFYSAGDQQHQPPFPFIYLLRKHYQILTQAIHFVLQHEG